MTVVVVGGGVLGMMHALEARRLGHDVVHLEREPGSRGASVRNFGLIGVSGRAPGPELELARRARVQLREVADPWLDVAERAAVGQRRGVDRGVDRGEGRAHGIDGGIVAGRIGRQVAVARQIT
jgi:glycine/D-amino acid oxidase-like deaminating enzyme